MLDWAKMDYQFQMAWHVGEDYPEWGSAPRRPLVKFDAAHQGEWLESVIGKDVSTGKDMIFHILKCEYCISVHAWPLPSFEAFYAAECLQYEIPGDLAGYERDRKWWCSCVHQPLLCQSVALRARAPHFPHARVRVLEVGAGLGIALDVAAAMGCATTAIELSPLYASPLRQRGHMVWEGTLETLGMPHGALNTYDIIYLYEVLGHQPCPEDFLLRCYEHMAPGGVLVVCVPNDANPLQYQVCAKLGIAPYWYDPPHHLFYFTPKTLQLLIRRCGFDMHDMRGTYPLEQYLLRDGQNYLGNESLERKVHTWRMEDELFALRSGHWEGREQQYRRQLAEKRWGRDIYCLAQKPYGTT